MPALAQPRRIVVILPPDIGTKGKDQRSANAFMKGLIGDSTSVSVLHRPILETQEMLDKRMEVQTAQVAEADDIYVHVKRTDIKEPPVLLMTALRAGKRVHVMNMKEVRAATHSNNAAFQSYARHLIAWAEQSAEEPEGFRIYD